MPVLNAVAVVAEVAAVAAAEVTAPAAAVAVVAAAAAGIVVVAAKAVAAVPARTPIAAHATVMIALKRRTPPAVATPHAPRAAKQRQIVDEIETAPRTEIGTRVEIV